MARAADIMRYNTLLGSEMIGDRSWIVLEGGIWIFIYIYILIYMYIYNYIYMHYIYRYAGQFLTLGSPLQLKDCLNARQSSMS